MFHLPRDTCMVKMFLLCQFFSMFPHMIFHLFCVFPSFSFRFHSIFLFSSWRYVCLESFFLPELSSFLFRFLVSFLCSLLYIFAFMVDYSLVRLDCPSVSFFFACLCGFLEAIGRKHPKVRLFIGRNCLFRFVFLFLFPLVHRSVGIAQTLTMSGEREVNSSELKTSLSTSKDRGALEVTSPSTSYKVWGIHCAHRKKDEKRITDRFQFPSSIRIRIPDSDDRACHSYTDEVCFYETDFVSVLHFLIHPFVREIFFILQLAPA